MSRDAFTLFAALLIAGTSAEPSSASMQQCKECGVTKRNDKRNDSEEADRPPEGGHPKLRSGRIRGALVTFRHGKTAKGILRPNWHYPKVKAGEDGKCLTRKAAFAAINGVDSSLPLIVMRGCRTCAKTDHPLLDAPKDNDEVRLLSRWFHLVKLPAEVAEKAHPLHTLFAETGAKHLFLAHWNGTGRVDLTLRQTRGRLQKAMVVLISEANDKKPGRALATLLGLLATFDKHDEARRTLNGQLQRETLKPSPSVLKLAKLRKMIASTQKQREQTLQRVKRVSDLGARPIPRKR